MAGTARSLIFPFKALPAEIRNDIYQRAIDVRNTKPKAKGRGVEQCPPLRLSTGGHALRIGIKDPAPVDYEWGTDEILGNFYPWRSGGCPSIYPEGYKATSRPAILSLDRQTRREALPLFYATHRFIFIDACLDKTLEWLVMISKSVSLKHIGGVEAMTKRCSAEQDVAKAALILLSEVYGIDIDVSCAMQAGTYEQLVDTVKAHINALSLAPEAVAGISARDMKMMVRSWVPKMIVQPMASSS
ncbi:hypothetical protein LTR81_027789 [Elasticomyces elasticus]